MSNLNIKFIPAAALGLLLLSGLASRHVEQLEAKKINAMCYVRIPERLTYKFFCSTCKKVSLYDHRYSLVISSLKRELVSIKGMDIKVVDKEFCKHCYPKLKVRRFSVEIAYPNEKNPIEIKVTRNEAQKLYNFLVKIVLLKKTYKENKREKFLIDINKSIGR